MWKDLFPSMAEFWTFLVIVVCTVVVATLFHRLSGRFVRKSSLAINNDPTNYRFLRHALTAIIYVVGFSWAVYRFEPLRAVANTLLASASILAIAVGFAAQKALGNVISGLFIIMFKPFRVRDRVVVRDNMRGVIEDITLRHTVIRDFENRRIIIPNSIISDEVLINADIMDPRINKHVEVGISYDSDVKRAKEILREEALNHPSYIDGRSEEQIAEGIPEVPIRMISWNDSSVMLRAWVWTTDPITAFYMQCDILESVKRRYEEEGIEIPFPHRTIVYKTDIAPSQSPEA
ncbi:MAG: mechanosensitive ion channel family protein [Saprospiraceae bacterium]|nr:mechanosensitive ion channel family protein [Saprospiraceae bacterium]